MMPPEAPVTDPLGRGAGSAPAVSVCPPVRIEVLRKRPDFLRAAAALRQAAPGFLLQARARQPGEAAAPEAVRVGYTCSKKLGNAVARNRAKRRLREIARLVLPGLARPGWDYVLVGRPEATASRDFTDLQADLRRAMAQVHDGKPRPPHDGAPRGRRGRKG
ncbi:ribonuclease P protein component [Paenirhodobacter sp.]|jgi:ribonuclease P protein component|uniref:ribonuclease P protein component n=1 Tax=Paenirhodobacter sp. TaxID=1965326 RepID=UPI003B50A595